MRGQFSLGEIGKLASVMGVVTRTSEVRPELLQGTFKCLECGGIVKNVDQQYKYSEGPFVNGDMISATDLSLAPKLYHMEIVLGHYKNWYVPESLPYVKSYMKVVSLVGAQKSSLHPNGFFYVMSTVLMCSKLKPKY